MKSIVRALFFAVTLISLASAPAGADHYVDRLASDDNRTGWRRLPPVPATPNMIDVVAHPSDPSMLFASTNVGVIKSTDGGQHWSVDKVRVERARLTIDRREPATMFAAGNWSAVRSTDGGETWSGVYPGRNVRGITVDPSNSAIAYAALADGLARSTNGGVAWSSIGDGQLPLGYYGFEGGNVAVDAETPTTVYAVGSGGVIRSTDGGDTWQTILSDLNGDVYFRKVVLDPSNASTIYVQAFRAVYRSDDAGAHWQHLYSAPPFPGFVLIDLAIDPIQPAQLFLATNEGVLRTGDRGQTWTHFNKGLPTVFVNSVMIDSAGNLYAATERGLYVTRSPRAAARGASSLTISLRTAAGNYVSADHCGGTHVHANARDAGPCETFVMYDLDAGDLNDGDLVVLQAPDGAYVVAEEGGHTNGRGTGDTSVNANRISPAEWETFTIQRSDGPGPIAAGDSISLRSFNGGYVAAEGGGGNGCACDSRLTADRSAAFAWETFILVVR